MKAKIKRGLNWEGIALEKEFKLSAIAKSQKVSLRTLRRFIVREFHEPAHNWLLRLRMEIAKRMLRAGMLLKVIAVNLQYKYYPTFARQFRKVVGMTAKEYRNQFMKPSSGRIGEQLMLF